MTRPLNKIRLVRRDDLDSLVELAAHASFGLTTLPADPARLSRRIEASIAGDQPLLVMVDNRDTRVIGTAGLFRRVGDAQRAEPFYAYRIERSVHRSDSFQVHHEIDVLHLVKLFNGPTELGTLFLHPEHRGGGNGRVLSLSRFLLMFLNPDQYDRQVIAELRGVIDAAGHSPFWDSLGRLFFQVEFPVADALSARDKRFIAELMPHHPIYVPMLSPEAQSVIGDVHPDTRPARKLLESEGFHSANMVDIFDAGPCLRCDTAAVRTIREACCVRVDSIGEVQSERAESLLIATTRDSFQLVADMAVRDSETIQLSDVAARTLHVEAGELVCVSPLRGSSTLFGKNRPVPTERLR